MHPFFRPLWPGSPLRPRPWSYAVAMWRYRIFFLFLTAGLAAGVLWASQRVYVAEVVSDASRDESILTVQWIRPVSEGKQVWIEHRDGGLMQTYTVKHVYEHHLILKERIQREILAGSRVLQELPQ